MKIEPLYTCITEWQTRAPYDISTYIAYKIDTTNLYSNEYITAKSEAIRYAQTCILRNSDFTSSFFPKLTNSFLIQIDKIYKDLIISKKSKCIRIAIKDKLPRTLPTMTWEDSLYYINYNVDNIHIAESTRSIIDFFRNIFYNNDNDNIGSSLIDISINGSSMTSFLIYTYIRYALREITCLEVAKEVNLDKENNEEYSIYPLLFSCEFIPEKKMLKLTNENFQKSNFMAVSNFVTSSPTTYKRYILHDDGNLLYKYAKDNERKLMEACMSFLIYISLGYDFNSYAVPPLTKVTNFLSTYEGNPTLTCRKLSRIIGDEKLQNELVILARNNHLPRMTTAPFANSKIDWSPLIRKRQNKENIVRKNLEDNWKYFHGDTGDYIRKCYNSHILDNKVAENEDKCRILSNFEITSDKINDDRINFEIIDIN